jgi:hypothetical protein
MITLPLIPSRQQTVSQCEKPQFVITSDSEESCIFSYLQGKDFSASPRNDNCDTVCQGRGRVFTAQLL